MTSIAKVSFEELSVVTTNEKWEPAFNSQPELHFRQVKLTGFSINLNINKNFEDNAYNSPSKKARNIKLSYPSFLKNQLSYDKKINARMKSKYFYDEREALESEYKRLRENDTYLLFPIDINLRIKTQVDTSREITPDIQRTVWIELNDPVIFVLNNDYVKYLSALADHIEFMKIVQKNIHLRPSEPPKEKPKAWWVYAIRSVTEERKRLGTMLKNSTKNLLNMRKYLDLYKRKQTIVIIL